MNRPYRRSFRQSKGDMAETMPPQMSKYPFWHTSELGEKSQTNSEISEIRKYATITGLDEVILNRLINRITIGEAQTVDGEKMQQVRIKYNFVRKIPG